MLSRNAPLAILATITMLAASGCLEPEAQAKVEAGTPRSNANQTAEEVVYYSFNANVAGTTPPNPQPDQPGPLVPGAEPSKTDSFVINEANVSVKATINSAGGSGDGRFEIQDGAGKTIFISPNFAALPLGSSALGGGAFPATLFAGKHTVRFFVAGEVNFSIQITSAPAACEGDELTTEVYKFQGDVTGTSPANRDGGGSVTGAPPAKTEKFAITKENTTLDPVFQPTQGAGDVRVEIVGPNNAQVYLSNQVQVIGPGTSQVNSNEARPRGPMPIGEYTVNYYVMGHVTLSLIVNAKEQAAESACGDADG